MANWLLKAKHWQIFSAFAAGYLIYTFLKADPVIAGCIFLALLVLYVGYYAFLGNILFSYLPRKAYYNITWFLIDAFVVIAAYACTLIIFDGNWEVDGFAALPIFYLFFAIGHLFWFPAVALVAIETGNEPSFSQYAGTIIQVFCWPIGIWFIQPRLNRISRENQPNSIGS